MAFCTRCGSSNELDARYCNNCGHELESSAPSSVTPEKKNYGRWMWLLMMVLLALAAAGTTWHLKNVDFCIMGDAEIKTDSKKKPDGEYSSPSNVLEKLPDAEEIRKRASSAADEIFGSDQDVRNMATGPTPLQKGLNDVETAASYYYTPHDCDTLFTDVGQQVAYSIQNEITRVTKISEEEENSLGKQISRQVKKIYQGKLDIDRDRLSYVRALGSFLTSGVSRKGINYHFHVIRSDEENAFATPGGGIYILTGMLNKVENEAQLASVLAHEIKHVDLRHCIAVYQVVAKLPDVVQNPASIVAHLSKNPYSTRTEADADRRGLELIYAFGYSPYQIVNFWEKASKANGQPAEDASGRSPVGKIFDTVIKETGNVLSTHPKSGKRACLLKNHIIKLQEKYPMVRVYVGKWNYDNNVPMFETKM